MNKIVFATAVAAVMIGGIMLLANPAQAVSASLYDSSGSSIQEFLTIAPGSSIVAEDIDADGVKEIIVGSPPGVRATVTIYEQDGTEVRTIYPFSDRFKLGVNVAVGKLSSKSSYEIIVVPRRGAGPHILRYTVSGKLLSPGFFAYSERFHGGVNVTTGDINGDGYDEIICGAGPGGGAHVRVLDKDGKALAQILPEDAFPNEGFWGGVVVGAIDYDDDGEDEIVLAPQTRHVADIKVFEPKTRQKMKQFRAYGTFTGGVSLSINTSGGGKRVLLGAGAGGGPHVLQYNLTTGLVDGANTFPFDSSWRGGVTVAFVKYDGKVKYVGGAGAVNLNPEELAGFGAIQTNDGSVTVGGQNSAWEERTVTTSRGSFGVNMVRANLKNPNLRIRTLTGSSKDCNEVPCTTRSLGSYVDQVHGFAGINGSYFCPADYGSCAGQEGAFYWMWYNTMTRVFSNAYQNQFNQGPVIAFDTSNNYYYYKNAPDWPGKAEFESKNKTVLRGVLSNGPGLVYESKIVVSDDQLDDKQRTVKSNRSAIGFKGDDVYLVVASGATVTDLGYVMKELGMEHAMNLDGGGSSSLIYNGEYKVGPGRNLPNAFILTEN